MFNKKIILLGASIVVVGGTAIYGMGEMIKNGVEDSLDMTAKPPVYAMAGTVNSIEEGTIKVRGEIDGDGVDERTVMTNNKTLIMALVPLSGKELQQSMKEFSDENKEGVSNTSPLYKEVPLAPSDLRITMEVNVKSKDDIRTTKTITADEITFYAPPSTPPGK